MTTLITAAKETLAIPALLIAVRHSNTIVFKSNAPALLPWYNMANSPETCGD